MLLILGVDGSGKNHVANVAVDALGEAGMPVGVRPGYLSARPTSARTSEGKRRLRLLEERLFLAAFPVLRPIVPLVAAALVQADVLRWQRRSAPRGRGAPAVVVSHTPVRVLAFALGHRGVDQPLRVPGPAAAALRRLASVPGLRPVVLDVSPEVRARRLAERAMRGRLDHFDRYLADPTHAELAERIEATMVELAERHLGATVVVNDDLDLGAIAEALGLDRLDGCGAGGPTDPHGAGRRSRGRLAR